MNLYSRVARLDDASGELTLSLHKLEMEATRGALNREEQIDFLHDLHRAFVRKLLHPWRSRARRLAVVGVLLALAALMLPLDLAHRDLVFPAGLGLGGVLLVAAGTCLILYLRGLREERRWLHHEEAEVQAGHSILGAR